MLPGPNGFWPLPSDAVVARRVPAGARPGASRAVTRAAVLLLCLAAAPRAVAAQGLPPDPAAERAEALRLAGRPWHAAETLLAAAAREAPPNAAFIVEGAEAELHARRYDRARSLLIGQPWLEDCGQGEALAVLAGAEAGLGRAASAAAHYAAARERAGGGPRGALLAVHEALAWEAVGATDSAAAAYAAARKAGLPAIDGWLRLRQARVTRDTAQAFRLLADLPSPAARDAAAARAQALLAAGDSAAALEAFAQAGRSLDLARLALPRGDSVRAPDAPYRLMAPAPPARAPPAAGGGGLAPPPADTAAPTALYVLGDWLDERGEQAGAARWFAELIQRYPADLRSSIARFRLATEALRDSLRDSAVALFRSEVAANAPQRMGARFWLGKLALLGGDTAAARATWVALAREDSIGYYGVRARREVDLPPLHIAAAALPAPSAAGAASLGRLDTPLLPGPHSPPPAGVRAILGRAPQQELDALLAWSAGLALRGSGPAAVRLGWQAALKSPNDPRVLRAIFPWPNRPTVEAEAAEFGVDPLLLAAIVRQESVFDAAALSPAGARGLAQLLPGSAALTGRGLDVAFYPDWITVPDLNLHLGAAHLQELLRRFGDRVDAAVAAYNAGVAPVKRWLARAGTADPDEFIELIPYQENRGYVRAVLRNREVYRALNGATTN